LGRSVEIASYRPRETTKPAEVRFRALLADAGGFELLYRFELLRAYLIDGFPPPRKAGEVSEFLWSVPVDLDGLRDGLM
jgi:hypothetical protein